MVLSADQRYQVSVGETHVIPVDFTDLLYQDDADISGDTADTITSITSVSEVTTSDLTIASSTIGSTGQNILGRSVLASNWIYFTVSGGSAGGGNADNGDYQIRITVVSTNGSTFVRDIFLGYG